MTTTYRTRHTNKLWWAYLQDNNWNYILTKSWSRIIVKVIWWDLPITLWTERPTI